VGDAGSSILRNSIRYTIQAMQQYYCGEMKEGEKCSKLAGDKFHKYVHNIGLNMSRKETVW
jgi:hypothetical protein